MKAIIVTHPTRNTQGCIYGIDYDKLQLLAEFRSKVKKSIKPRYKTIEFKDEFDMSKKLSPKGISMFKMTGELYYNEINNYVNELRDHYKIL